MNQEREIMIKDLTASLEHLSFVQESYPQYIELSEDPTVLFLHQLTLFPHETVLFRLGGHWYAFPGMEWGFSSVWIPKDSTIVIHCHGNHEGEKFPSPGDLANSLKGAVNCVVSLDGLTIFRPPQRKPIRGMSGRPSLEELEAASRRAVLTRDEAEYREFLRKAGVDWRIILWEELTEAELEKILGS